MCVPLEGPVRLSKDKVRIRWASQAEVVAYLLPIGGSLFNINY